LTTLGFKVVEAANGDEAVALARAIKPDLIFMDLVMPGLDGFEAVRRIRAVENGGGVPIVALSASAFEDTRQLSAIRGCNGFLSKPVRFDQIIDALERHLALEWRREERPAVASAPACDAALAELGALSERELAHLLELAQHGDIVGFGASIARLSDAGHVPPEFTRTMRAMMSRYDMQAIREYLRPYVR